QHACAPATSRVSDDFPQPCLPCTAVNSSSGTPPVARTLPNGQLGCVASPRCVCIPRGGRSLTPLCGGEAALSDCRARDRARALARRGTRREPAAPAQRVEHEHVAVRPAALG